MGSLTHDHIIAIITVLLGVMITAIGALLLGRIIYMTKQMEKEHLENKKEFKSIWDKIEDDNKQCSLNHSAIAGDIGYIKGILENIQSTLTANQEQFFKKLDRVTDHLKYEKELIDKRQDNFDKRLDSLKNGK